MQASMHARYVLACSGLYLSQTGSDQRYQSIDRIRRTYQTCLSTLFERSTQFCLHARYVLVCICPYLSRFGSDPKDRDMYGIEGTCRSWLWCLSTSTHASVHAHYFLACIGPNISQIGLDQRSKYLYNQENILDLCDHIVWPEHASLHACTLCA